MKTPLNYITIFLSITVLILMGACKKNDATQNFTHRYDFRDSLIGTYIGIYYHYRDIGNYPYYTNTMVGSDSFVVTKLTTDTTSIIINGSILSLVSTNDTVSNFTADTNSVAPTMANFNYHKILSYYWGQNAYVSYRDYYYCYWAGKQ